MTTTTIVEFRAQNFMRLRALSIRPDGQPVVVLGGKNQQGKTSVLNGIKAVLGGKKHVPGVPLREGEDEGEVELHLSDGIVARRTFTEDGKSKLIVTDGNGKVSTPQALLEKLLGPLSFDPLAYSRKEPGEQARILRELAGIDTTVLDARRKQLYDQRTEKNREVKRLKALLDKTPQIVDAPAVEVSVAELAAELEMQAEHNREVQEEKGRVEARRRALDEADAKIMRLRDELEAMREERMALAKALEEAQARANAATMVDLTPLREQIKTAEENNAKVRQNAERERHRDDLREVEGESNELTLQLGDIDAEKLRMVAEAKLPLPGLGFDDCGVTLNGMPLKQASGAEQLKLSVAIGFALNPGFKVCLVDQGSELDEDNLRLLDEIVAAEGGQIWLVRVSTGEECSVVIEDGMVRGGGVEASVAAEAVPSPEAAASVPDMEDFA